MATPLLLSGALPVLLTRLSAHGALQPDPDRAGRTFELELPPHRSSPAAARHAVQRAFADWGLGEPVTEDVCLLVSELVTNAVMHARTPFVLAVEHEGANIAVAVSDGLAAMPWRKRGAPQDESGRGIGLVSDLGSNWGVVRTVLGKTVWVTSPAEGQEAAVSGRDRVGDIEPPPSR